jgi:hypothetical protein
VNPLDDRTDPIEGYVATLAAALHGPARAKARMVEEIRDGLVDAVAAHSRDGVPYERAAHEAVGAFGTADELVPSCQRELTIVQTRDTARAVALTVPFLIIAWHLIWTADHDQHWLPRTAQLLAAHLAGAAAITALLAAAALAATGTLAQWLPTPHRLPLVVAWTGTTASAAMPIATLALAAASPLATDWPLIALAGAITVASHVVVAGSARACRRCARLPTARPSLPSRRLLVPDQSGL